MPGREHRASSIAPLLRAIRYHSQRHLPKASYANRHNFCYLILQSWRRDVEYYFAVFFAKFAVEVRELGPINLAVSSSSPMIEMWVLMNPQKELPAVIPAEGPIFCVGLGHQVACAVARSIFASLAAAPLFAASGRRLRIGRQGFISLTAFFVFRTKHRSACWPAEETGQLRVLAGSSSRKEIASTRVDLDLLTLFDVFGHLNGDPGFDNRRFRAGGG